MAGHTRLTSCAVALTPCVAQLPASCTLAPVLASCDATCISIAVQVPEPYSCTGEALTRPTDIVIWSNLCHQAQLAQAWCLDPIEGPLGNLSWQHTPKNATKGSQEGQEGKVAEDSQGLSLDRNQLPAKLPSPSL